MSKARRMRIAYVISRYPAVSHTFIQREVMALRRLGIGVDTFSIRRSDPSALLSKADRSEAATTFSILPAHLGRMLAAHARALLTRPVRYVRTLALALCLGSVGTRERLWRLFYFVEAVVLWDECRRREICRIHAHFANVASDVAMLASELGNDGSDREWSWSFTMHGPTELYEVRRHRLVEKIERASLVVCISDFCRSQLMGLVDETHWPKLRTVRCGVDVQSFRPSYRGQPRAAAGAALVLRILCVGRLTPVKGQAVLLEAIAELKRRGVRAQVTMVGDGPTRAPLEQMARRLGIAPLVELTGAIGQDEIRAHYAATDVFCLPSFAEGLPVVLMEAMAMGLPVVTTRITGTPELVEDGTSGRLVSPARVDELADALAELACAPQRAESMGRKGREKVCSEFDLELSAESLREVFLESNVAVHDTECRSRDSLKQALSGGQA